MRDLIVTLMVFSTLPYILASPWVGVLAWSWLSYMNPHRLAWGFAYSMPFAQIVAITLLMSIVISREKFALPRNGIVALWAAFLIWLSICTFLAIYPDHAFRQLETILKIQLITLVTMLMMNSFARVNHLIWVICFSIGFYSVKGGVFTLLTGGAFHVYGPGGSYIKENNALAVATLMIIPMMIYIHRFPPKRWVKTIMPILIFLSLVSSVGSQSRGALLAILSVAVFFWWQSKSKFVTLAAFLVLGSFGYMFMPQTWHDRMASITEYQEDTSAMQRIRAWEFSIAIANGRFTGGGFNCWSVENYNKYLPGVNQSFVAHSIYFGILGEAGWPGLILFLLILFMVWRQLNRVISLTRDDPDRQDYNFLARMLKISIIAFMSGGAFLSLTFFDLAWHIMAMAIAINNLVVSDFNERTTKKPEPALNRRGMSYGAGRKALGRS